VPLTDFQSRVLSAIAGARNADSYLAGAAALHLDATGLRYSNDLDLFHTTAAAANAAFSTDADTLRAAGWDVVVDTQYPGFVKARVTDGTETTEIDWAHESAWRFLPLVPLDGGGVMLHPIDLAVNKLVALAHRREPRDVVDALYADRHILPFPALVWAVVEKNPGLNPASYLEQFRRRTLTPEDAAYLRFSGTYDVADAAHRFRSLVDATDHFINGHLELEPGALFQDRRTGGFFLPLTPEDWSHAREHRGRLGGVVPLPADHLLAPPDR
jgi:hypothetical protein